MSESEFLQASLKNSEVFVCFVSCCSLFVGFCFVVVVVPPPRNTEEHTIICNQFKDYYHGCCYYYYGDYRASK